MNQTALAAVVNRPDISAAVNVIREACADHGLTVIVALVSPVGPNGQCSVALLDHATAAPASLAAARALDAQAAQGLERGGLN